MYDIVADLRRQRMAMVQTKVLIQHVLNNKNKSVLDTVHIHVGDVCTRATLPELIQPVSVV